MSIPPMIMEKIIIATITTIVDLTISALDGQLIFLASTLTK